MPEPFDVYADTFRVRISPWGSNLTFDLHAAQPGIEDAQGEFAEPAEIGTVRMSNEHLKAMVFILQQQIVSHERAYGIRYDVPLWILNQMRITQEEWNRFWGYYGS